MEVLAQTNLEASPPLSPSSIRLPESATDSDDSIANTSRAGTLALDTFCEGLEFQCFNVQNIAREQKMQNLLERAVYVPIAQAFIARRLAFWALLFV
jgi:hypothetical protein